MSYSRLDVWLAKALQKGLPPAVRLALDYGGESGGPAGVTPALTSPAFKAPAIRIKDRKTLVSLLVNPQMTFGDAYSEGRLEIEGNLVRVLEDLYRLPASATARVVSWWLSLVQRNSLGGSRRNIHYHYDLSNDFYKLWLDAEMLYTCAYFPELEATLEQAQMAKMDHVCRKVWLRPGDLVVEAGCGWGSLALHMARRYGARVKAFNISHEQTEYARQRARAEGLASKVEFIEDDYRNIRGKADVFVSVGMMEHVGRSRLQEFGRVIERTIGDQGRGLIHFIGKNHPQPLSPWIRKRVFPGGYAPTIREAAEIFEPYDISVLDAENLRFHYARTLECWLSRYERAYGQVAQKFGETFARMWRLYLAGSIAAFRTGSLQLFQMVFAGSQCRSIPWNRAYLYQPAEKQSEQEPAWIRAIS